MPAFTRSSPSCSLPWEGVTLLHDFLHECEEMASWDAPCNWSQGVFSQTFFSGSPRNRVKAGATINKVDFGERRHRFGWSAERRFKNTSSTAVGARPQIGE